MEHRGKKDKKIFPSMVDATGFEPLQNRGTFPSTFLVVGARIKKLLINIAEINITA